MANKNSPISAIRRVKFFVIRYLLNRKIREKRVVTSIKPAGMAVKMAFLLVRMSHTVRVIRVRAANNWFAVPNMGHIAKKALVKAKKSIIATDKPELKR